MNYQEHIDKLKQEINTTGFYPTYLDSLYSRLEIGRWNINTISSVGLIEMAKLLDEDDSRYIEYIEEEDFDNYTHEFLLVVGQQPMSLKEQYEEVLRYWKMAMKVNRPYIGDEITEDILKHLEATGYVVKEG